MRLGKRSIAHDCNIWRQRGRVDAAARDMRGLYMERGDSDSNNEIPGPARS